MRVARGVVMFTLAIALSGCTGGGTAEFEDAVDVNNVPACRTWPVELAGDTYWEMTREQAEAWRASHKIPKPDSTALGVDAEQAAFVDTPQVHASAAWEDLDDGIGVLYRYGDGTALFIARTGNMIYFTDQERIFDTVC